MAKTSEKYEVLYIIDPDLGEEATAAIVAKFTDLINQNGEVTETDEWGKRKLAYLINDKSEGYYVLVRFTSGPAFPAELDRVMKITDGVYRSLITLAVE
ncbi:MAG: 30S ribosomal protein S6 [bacterium]